MHSLRGTTSTITLGVVLLVMGCTSTQERYDKAQDLERQGRYAEAARYYVEVLEKEPAWEGASERLLEVGNRAVEAYLDEAEAAELNGRFEEALRALDRLDALRADAADVGVTLAVPDDYAAYRQRLIDAAFADRLRDAERAEQRGNWDDALKAYDRARRYTDLPGQLAEIDRRQARVYLRWAAHELDRERYRAAFDHAQQALNLAGPGTPLGEQAHALQATALEAGTRYVAFLPLWRTDEVAREAPGNVVQDLNDVLLYDHWAEPLPFLATADAVQIRRELRRLRYDRTIITTRQAAEIGRAAEADYVVVGEWTAFARREKDLKETTRTARLKGRAATAGRRDTSYVEQRFRLELGAEVAYRIIDPRTRRVVDQGAVDAGVEGRVERAVFAGDYRDLDLSGAELSRFEDAERLAVEELGNDLVDALAARLADRVYERLLQQIP